MYRLKTIALMVIALLLTACGGGGGGTGNSISIDPVTLNNLAASTIQVTSPEPWIGYPLKFVVSIVADQAAENVSVAFFAIDKDRPNPR